MRFYEREQAMRQLREIQEASHHAAQMAVVTGRRRCGKTQLILKATEGVPTLYFFIARKAESLLCSEFVEQVQKKLGLTNVGDVSDFRTLFKALMAASKEQTFNVIIDEFQEFNTINANIFNDLQSLWDRNKDRSRICLFLVGNSNAQTTRLFDGAHAPLNGRVTSWVKLESLSTPTLKKILKKANPDYRPQDLLALYAFTGGVPKYVNELINAGAVRYEDFVKVVCQETSPFIQEGKQLLIEDFGKEYTIYFSILTCIANGISSRSLIEEFLQKEIGGYLTRLETDFHLIRKLTPLFSKSGSKNVRYVIADNFLRFWFRFFYKNMHLVEQAKYGELRRAVQKGFAEYCDLSLPLYFVKRLEESGEYSCIGGWWDHRGDNDIDLIALDEEHKKALIAGVARMPKQVNISLLTQKAVVLNEALEGYETEYRALTFEDI